MLVYVSVLYVLISVSLHYQRNNSFGNDSGNFSLRQTGEFSSMQSFQKSAGAESSTSAKNILSDLRYVVCGVYFETTLNKVSKGPSCLEPL